jgi:Flp pilus assembly protein TadG
MLSRLRRCDDGAVLVEYAFVLPVLLLLVFGLMQIGGMAWTQSALDFAVQEAARCAVVRPDLCGADAQIQSYAAAQASGLNVPASAFTVARPACGVQVSAAWNYAFIVSPFGGPPARLTAEVCAS